ncbi:MAG TPA: integrase family protein [Xanthobacteraceae bacterium]
MAGKTYFTEAGVKKLKPPLEGQRDYLEKIKRGLTLALRVSYGGTKAWRVIYYSNGKPRVETLGHYDALSVKAAREKAERFDPLAASASAEAGSFKEVAEKWMQHYVDAKRLRSKAEIERHLTYYVYPRWGRVPFFDIRRSTVNDLLDQIVAKHGASQADGVLATLRSIMNWYQTRDENYVSPIVKGMRRDQRDPSERARARILSDDEIRNVWKAAVEDQTPFGAIVRLLLLTAQRREKVAAMKWDDIRNGLWTITTEAREKGNAGKLELPPLALEIINSQQVIHRNPYVFPGSLRGRRHKSADHSRPPAFNSWSQRKAELDKKLPTDMPPWTLHDLRRTARSLMARARIPDATAERVLGHAVTGVQGTYNRHDYAKEKATAVATLAAVITRLVNPPSGNVISMPGRR